MNSNSDDGDAHPPRQSLVPFESRIRRTKFSF